MMGSGKFGNARARWMGVGPYFAMFPPAFCDRVIQKYSAPGDLVLDPFAGRGTAVFSASTLGRSALGIELNPVGWIYAATKLRPAPRDAVMARYSTLKQVSLAYAKEAKNLPEFFRYCFNADVLKFLLAARAELNWRQDTTDRTAMALILVNLHGKREDSLSNQMRQTKAMAPKYAVRWWRQHKLRPPDCDPVEFLSRKLQWRYAHGMPETADGRVYLGDSTTKLKQVDVAKGEVKLLLTSPPYFGITNYHYDQWLRLWMLGGFPDDRSLSQRHKGKFANTEAYSALLENVFGASVPLLAKNACVYVRTDRRAFTSRVTREVLQRLLPKHTLARRVRPFKTATQTALFGHFAPKFGEVDLIFTRN